LTTDDVLLKLEHPNTFKGKTLEEIYGVDGTNILKIESIWYTGKVYNLEIAVDHTYSGKGIIYHNSDVVVGRVLPKWTHPLTGETFSTHMDKMGWWVVCEVRNDLEIANKVWTEIRKGNLRSFSIAGSSRDKVQKVQNGVSFEQVNDLDTCEVAICSVKNTKIWTKRGLIPIQDVNTDDYAYTHMNRWRKVVRLMNREISDGVMKITTENGVLEFTPNHPFRVFKGNKYIWTPTSDLKIGDQLSMHEQTGSCSYCGTPLFKKLRGTIYGNYCCSKCHSSAPGNRKSHTVLSGDSGAISQSNKMKGKPSWNAGLNVDCLTDEQRERQIISCTSTEFREKRSKIQKEKWLDAQYRESQIKASHHNSTMNKAEDKINNFLQAEFPNEWKYVGSGEVWIGAKNPDFININGQKKIIEFWGEYWHRNHSKQDRIDYFKEYGYETLIVSDKDLNYADTIKEFCGNKVSRIINIEKQAYSGLVYNIEVEEDHSYTTEFAVVKNCEIPVNSGSHFDVLWDPEAINIFGY
jgi:hypothetical protein